MSNRDDSHENLEKAWEKRADNFAQIDARLPQGEKESEHFKSGLPPAPELKGVQKVKPPVSPQDRKKNRDKQREHYVRNRQEQIQRKRNERRDKGPAPSDKKANIVEDMLGMGIRPRSVVALNRMLAASPTWMDIEEPVSATRIASVMESFKTTLCEDMARISGVKVAKGNSNSSNPNPTSDGGNVSSPGSSGTGNSPSLRSCFVEGSQVKTASGLMRIQDLEPGSQVIGFDEITGVPKPLTVAKTASKKAFEWNQVHTSNTSFDVTDTHPILTRTGWTEAGNLKAGDVLLTYDEEGPVPEEVISVFKVYDEATVHLIEIEEDPHNYIVSGIVAHNAKISDDGDDPDWEAVKAEDVSEEDAREASIRQDEWQLAQDTTKMGYAIAKSLGATEAQAMAAGMYAFTQIPHEAVDAAILSATYWSE